MLRAARSSFDLIALRDTLASSPLGEVTQKHVFGLLLFGFGILVSLWPFHSWAPLGYGAAPSSAAMLHAGVLKKFGLYGLVQIALPILPLGAVHWSHNLAALAAVGNVVVIGLVTMAQRDLKQMVGYSSVMHMGYAFLGIAAGSALGVGGVVMFMVGHGLSVALLFLLVDLHPPPGAHVRHGADGRARAEGAGPSGPLHRRPRSPASGFQGSPISGASCRSLSRSGISPPGSQSWR